MFLMALYFDGMFRQFFGSADLDGCIILEFGFLEDVFLKDLGEGFIRDAFDPFLYLVAGVAQVQYYLCLGPRSFCFFHAFSFGQFCMCAWDSAFCDYLGPCFWSCRSGIVDRVLDFLDVFLNIAYALIIRLAVRLFG